VVTSPTASPLPQIADEHRREIIRFYLTLRVLFLAASLIILVAFPKQLNPDLSARDERHLWTAFLIFLGWSIPLWWSGWRSERRLGLADHLISISMLPDSFAIYLAAMATGGTAGVVYRSIYFLIAVHSYHFSANPWASQPWTPRGGLKPLLVGATFTVLCGFGVFSLLSNRSATPFAHYMMEFGLQAITATAFLSVRYADLRRAQRLAESQQHLHESEGKLFHAQEELDQAKINEGQLLKAMQGVSSIARISNEADLDKKLHELVPAIRANLGSEFCVLGLVRQEQLVAVARHTSFTLPDDAKQLLRDLKSRPIGNGLVGSLVQQKKSFRWNSEDGRDLVDLSEDELTRLRVSLDRDGTRRLRDEVFPSRAIRHVMVAPFTSQDGEERPLGYVLLMNKLADDALATQGFSDRDEERLKAIAAQLAVAISNFERHKADLARAEHEAFFSSLILTDDLDDLFVKVLDHLNKEYDSRVASLWLATEDGFGDKKETLRVVLRSVMVAEYPDAPSTKQQLEEALKQLNIFRPEDCYVGQFFREDNPAPREVTYVEDMRSAKDSWESCVALIGTSHLIAIPICRHHENPLVKVESAVISAEPPLAGVVCLRPRRPFVLTDERQEALERFADYLAVIIDQVRFRRRYRQIETLKNHLPELQSADLNEFYLKIVRLVREALSAEACSLFTVEPKERALTLKATTADTAIRIDRDGTKHVLRTADYIDKPVYPSDEPSITAKIAEVRKTTVIYDVNRNTNMSRLFMEVTETPKHESLIGAPVIRTDGSLFGVIRCINRKKAGALLPVFVKGDQEFLDLIVGILARFIENAEASASKKDFLRMLAHELATPLAALKNQIDYFDATAKSGDFFHNLDGKISYLAEQADFIDYLVRDIQYQFGKGASIQPRFEFSLADLKPTIERIKKLLLPTARFDKQIDIRTGTTRMPYLYVDVRRMEQVIFNLVQNAVKYSRVHGGDIFIGYDFFEEEDERGNFIKWHRLKCQDRGIGVLKSDLDFIFDEYRRGTNVEGAPSGTGLGLAVAKRIVEAHGGRITVTNLKNPTEFSVDLPDDLSRRPPTHANLAY